VLSAILPHYLEYLRTDSSSLDYEEKLKGELTGLSSLVTSINVLIKSSEVLTRLDKIRESTLSNDVRKL